MMMISNCSSSELFLRELMVHSSTFRKSRVDQDLFQLDFGLPGHPQSRHVETFVFTEPTFCFLTVDPEQKQEWMNIQLQLRV